MTIVIIQTILDQIIFDFNSAQLLDYINHFSLITLKHIKNKLVLSQVCFQYGKTVSFNPRITK